MLLNLSLALASMAVQAQTRKKGPQVKRPAAKPVDKVAHAQWEAGLGFVTHDGSATAPATTTLQALQTPKVASFSNSEHAFLIQIESLSMTTVDLQGSPELAEQGLSYNDSLQEVEGLMLTVGWDWRYHNISRYLQPGFQILAMLGSVDLPSTYDADDNDAYDEIYGGGASYLGVASRFSLDLSLPQWRRYLTLGAVTGVRADLTELDVPGYRSNDFERTSYDLGLHLGLSVPDVDVSLSDYLFLDLYVIQRTDSQDRIAWLSQMELGFGAGENYIYLYWMRLHTEEFGPGHEPGLHSVMKHRLGMGFRFW